MEYICGYNVFIEESSSLKSLKFSLVLSSSIKFVKFFQVWYNMRLYGMFAVLVFNVVNCASFWNFIKFLGFKVIQISKFFNVFSFWWKYLWGHRLYFYMLKKKRLYSPPYSKLSQPHMAGHIIPHTWNNHDWINDSQQHLYPCMKISLCLCVRRAVQKNTILVAAMPHRHGRQGMKKAFPHIIWVLPSTFAKFFDSYYEESRRVWKISNVMTIVQRNKHILIIMTYIINFIHLLYSCIVCIELD